MCDVSPLSAISPADYAQMPSRISSTDPLLHVGKHELETALRMPAANPWVADWLFSSPAAVFHPRAPALPPEAFHAALAMHLSHHISTPICPARRAAVVGAGAGATTAATGAAAPPPQFTVTKDIDLLLVPVLNVAGLTVGYAFLNGLTAAAMANATGNPAAADPSPSAAQFIAGRFCFDNAKRDFLMAVNSMSPHMMGLMSMRMRADGARDRSFFAIPKAEYGPGNLPSRVLSLQCNVDYEVPAEHGDDLSATPDYDYDQRAEYGDETRQVEDVCSELTRSEAIPGESGVVDGVVQARDFANFADDDDDNEAPVYPNMFAAQEPAIAADGLMDQVVPGMPPIALESLLSQSAAGMAPPAPPQPDASDALADSWADGLDAIATVVSPFDDPSGLLPDIMSDFAKSAAFSDDVDRLFTQPDEEQDHLLSSGPSPGLREEDAQSPPKTGVKRPQRLDELALSPVNSTSTLSHGSDLSVDNGNTVPHTSSDFSWILSSSGATPDGVGVPRVPGPSQTSSGSFDMSTLVDSLATIEKSLKGSFYGPKVRKDILHPLTGELMSRCTGKVRANINNVDPKNLTLLRTIAAQAYYSSILTVSPDNRLLPPSLASTAYTPGATAARPSSPTTIDAGAVRQPTDPPRRKQGRTDPQKRPAPAPLAPRPVVTVALPPGLPHPEVLQLPEQTSANPSAPVPAGPTDEKSAREAKLEAKRIKNRLSAARSNQKRRAQLEAQKQELAALRERVEELKWRETKVSEENEILKRQILSET